MQTLLQRLTGNPLHLRTSSAPWARPPRRGSRSDSCSSSSAARRGCVTWPKSPTSIRASSGTIHKWRRQNILGFLTLPRPLHLHFMYYLSAKLANFSTPSPLTADVLCTSSLVLKVKRSRLANLSSVASTAWHASFDLLPPFLPLPPLVRTLRKLFSCGKRGIKEVYWVRGGEVRARKCERGVSNCLIPNFLPEILHRYM